MLDGFRVESKLIQRASEAEMDSRQRQVMIVVAARLISDNLECRAKILHGFVRFQIVELNLAQTEVVYRQKSSASRIRWILLPEAARQRKTLLVVPGGLWKASHEILHPS